MEQLFILGFSINNTNKLGTTVSTFDIEIPLYNNRNDLELQLMQYSNLWYSSAV